MEPRRVEAKAPATLLFHGIQGPFLGQHTRHPTREIDENHREIYLARKISGMEPRRDILRVKKKDSLSSRGLRFSNRPWENPLA